MTKQKGNKGRGAIEKWEDAKAKGRPLHEHITNLFKAGIGLTPVGGAIASLLSDYLPNSRANRLEEFAEATAADIKRLESRIDVEYLRTDDFAFVFERSFKGVAESYKAEKIEAFRAILLNSMLPSDVTEDAKEYFLSLVDRLTALHIRMLRFMGDPSGFLSAGGISSGNIRGGFRSMFATAFPGIAPEVTQSAFQDLYQFGMTTMDQKIFGMTTSAQGLDLLRGRLSPLGDSFIRFCTVP